MSYAYQLGQSISQPRATGLDAVRQLFNKFHTKSAVRYMPDVPTEHEPFREYNYSKPYFKPGEPGLYGDHLPLKVTRYDGAKNDERLGFISPIKDPKSLHKPGT